MIIWATAMTCFFGFFRAGEITIPSDTSFSSAIHLAWGDGWKLPPKKRRVYLKRLKTDQCSRGVSVWIGATGDDLRMVQAVVSYAARRGITPGPFFRFEDGAPLTKVRFVEKIRGQLGCRF